MRLFEEFERSDPSPAGDLEDSYAFLNRVAQPFWDRVRRELERWFSELPLEEASDLGRRFQSPDRAQHYAAWWELYLYRIFSQLGWNIERHPRLVDSSSRPDFVVRRGDQAFLVEAFTTFSGISANARNVDSENWIKAAINEVRSDSLFVWLSIERRGTRRPRKREIIGPLQAWLETLDADDVLARGPEQAPETTLQAGDWQLGFRAFAAKPERRGVGDRRVLGIGPVETSYADDAGALRRALERKRRKYGSPEIPLVFAVLAISGFIDDEDVEGALFGSIAYRFNVDDPSDGDWIRRSDGFWASPRGPAGTRVSALLLGSDLHSYNVARAWPRLWRNPCATHPLEVDLPFPATSITDDGVRNDHEPSSHPWDALALPEGWPGPEGPFERRC